MGEQEVPIAEGLGCSRRRSEPRSELAMVAAVGGSCRSRGRHRAVEELGEVLEVVACMGEWRGAATVIGRSSRRRWRVARRSGVS